LPEAQPDDAWSLLPRPAPVRPAFYTEVRRGCRWRPARTYGRLAGEDDALRHPRFGRRTRLVSGYAPPPFVRRRCPFVRRAWGQAIFAAGRRASSSPGHNPPAGAHPGAASDPATGGSSASRAEKDLWRLPTNPPGAPSCWPNG
jgi:hypothetical protein